MSEYENDLAKKFAAIMWRMHSFTRRFYKAFGPEGNPNQGQGRVLALLKMQPELSQKDLAYLLGMRPQSLGELLTKLERSGYITRTPSDADKRVMIVRLTDEGRAAAERQPERPGVDGIFSVLTEEEQQTLSGYLDRILAGLNDGEEQTDGCPPFEMRDGECRARGPFGGFVNFNWENVPGGFQFGVRSGPGPNHHGGPHGRGPCPPPRPAPGADVTDPTEPED